MATDKDVAALKSRISRLETFLRRQKTWADGVAGNIKRLNRRAKRNGGLGPGPTVTDPPPPPPKRP